MMKKTFLLIAFLGMNLVNGGYLYVGEGETIEQVVYSTYGLKVENGKFLWYDPGVAPLPRYRIMRNEANRKYWKEFYKNNKNKRYSKENKVITNAAIIFDGGYFGKESRERKYTVTVEDYLIQRGCKTRIRLFYRLTEKKELEFSEDKKTWEKVKVELVYEDFTLEKDPPRDEDDPNDTSSIFFKLRISCKWFDEVFCKDEPSP